MTTDTTGVDRALGAIGTTFRLTRLYPPTHPAVQEALRQVGEALPPLAAVGTVEWKVGATGLHWHGQQLLPRNTQIAELAGLLYARGVRTLTLNPGMTAEHVLALFQVATGTAAPDAPTLGRITLTLGRRSAARLERLRPPTPAEGVTAVAPQLRALREVATSADAIAALDRLLSEARDPALLAAIDAAALALSDRTMVERMVRRLGEAHVPAEERESLVTAVGALASLSMGLVLDAFLAAPVEQRAPFRAAVRKAADRALEVLQGRLADKNPEVVAAAAEFVGLTGSPQAVTLLVPLLRHASEFAREAALVGLAEAGGREIARPAMPCLKDESVAVRAAAARTIAAAGDPASSTVLIRRVEQEPDEGVQAELLRAIGRLGAKEALEVLARFAEPGGMMHWRSTTARAAAVEGLHHIARPEARGLLELYSKDKEPAVRKAAEAALK